jgi:hypothetical protein
MLAGSRERLYYKFPDSEMDRFDATYDYFADPTELHARTMEIRKFLGMRPGQHMTPEQSEKAIKAIRSGKAPVDRGFGHMLTAPQLRQLHKFFPAAAGAVAGTTALQEQKYSSGGTASSLDDYMGSLGK